MFGQLFEGIKGILYPKICVACKAALTVRPAEELICGECFKKIKKNNPPFCHGCGRQLDKKSFSKNLCSACLKSTHHFDRAFSPCAYEGVIKDLVHEFKYHGKEYLGQPLSALMVEFIREFHLPIDYCDYIIPTPLHATRLREREFNQAQVLGKELSETLKKDMVSDVLIRHRHTRTQTELTPEERFANVRESFSVTKPWVIKDKNLLLVDDVFTTGATTSEAALALKNAGARIVFVLTLAN